MYWWAGLIVFLLFAALNVAIILLRKKTELSYAIAYSISAFLLAYKIVEYIYWQAIGDHLHFPVEFSALSYFILGVAVVFRIRKMEPLGAFVALLAGLMFSISFWVSPTSFIEQDPPYLLIASIINHHLLYFASMLLFANSRRYSYKNCWVLLLGVGVMVAYSWIIYLFTNYTKEFGKPIIIQICDGSILSWLGIGEVQGWITAIYVIVIVLLFIGLLVGFYSLNNVMAKKRKKLGLYEDYYPSKWIDTYQFRKK